MELNLAKQIFTSTGSELGASGSLSHKAICCLRKKLLQKHTQFLLISFTLQVAPPKLYQTANPSCLHWLILLEMNRSRWLQNQVQVYCVIVIWGQPLAQHSTMTFQCGVLAALMIAFQVILIQGMALYVLIALIRIHISQAETHLKLVSWKYFKLPCRITLILLMLNNKHFCMSYDFNHQYYRTDEIHNVIQQI